MSQFFSQKLLEREEKFLLRELQLPAGVDFCSNDYLSFATDVLLQKKIQHEIKLTPSGSTGSRLLRGHNQAFEDLEGQLARWCQRESALYFPSGYQANLAALSALLNKESVVFSDQYNHASIIDGIRLSQAPKFIFRHNDLAHLHELLVENEKIAHKVVVVESVYSMQGDRAPLKEISNLCLEFDAQLVVDECHATGLFGSGLVEQSDLQRKVLLSIHSAGKALGASGAWIACDQIVKEFLVNFSRPFIYSTAPSPMNVVSLKTALEHYQEVGEERAEACFEKFLDFKKQLGVFFKEENILGEGPILFLKLGESHEALVWSVYLQSMGLDVRAIRYPTVPEGQAGLRISFHAGQSPQDMRLLLQAIKQRVLEC